MKHWRELDIEKYLVKYDCLNLINDYPWIRHLRLVINPRLSRVWGRAWNEGEMNWGVIELSEETITRHYGHIKETLIHELCHFIAAHHNDFGHGKIFKQMMKKYTGVDYTSRYHQGIYDKNGKINLTFQDI